MYEALGVVLDIFPPDDLRSLSLVSKNLREKVMDHHGWRPIVASLKKDIKLHPASLLENPDFPPVFVDPRHSPHYKKATPFQQATYLQQYRNMVIRFFKNFMDEDGQEHVNGIANQLRCVMADADQAGFFSFWCSSSTHLPDLENLLAACTAGAVKDHCVKLCLGEFRRQGLSCGRSVEVVMDGWKGCPIDVFSGEFSDLSKAVTGVTLRCGPKFRTPTFYF